MTLDSHDDYAEILALRGQFDSTSGRQILKAYEQMQSPLASVRKTGTMLVPEETPTATAQRLAREFGRPVADVAALIFAFSQLNVMEKPIQSERGLVALKYGVAEEVHRAIWQAFVNRRGGMLGWKASGGKLQIPPPSSEPMETTVAKLAIQFNLDQAAVVGLIADDLRTMEK